MRTLFLVFAAVLTVSAASPVAQQPPAAAQQPQAPKAKPEDTEVWEPVPPIVTPGATNDAAPSDAIVLFDGKSLNDRVSAKDKTPSGWHVSAKPLTLSNTT